MYFAIGECNFSTFEFFNWSVIADFLFIDALYFVEVVFWLDAIDLAARLYIRLNIVEDINLNIEEITARKVVSERLFAELGG